MFQISFIAFSPMSWYKDISGIYCYLIAFAVSWILGIVLNFCHFCVRTKRTQVHLIMDLVRVDLRRRPQMWALECVMLKRPECTSEQGPYMV